ncbi:MAG: serine O-acetyltransferase [Glaciecola sp.]
MFGGNQILIKNRLDYTEYLTADKLNGYYNTSFLSLLFSDSYRFMRLLRRLEYIKGTKKGPIWKILEFVTMVRFLKLSKKLGYSIPPFTCGPGLCLPHYGNIVINPSATVGKNCKIHVGVNIGAALDESEATPIIGDNCYIGPGAKIFGAVVIANGIKIGANAVVNKSCKIEGATLLGVPAKAIPTANKYSSSKEILI